MTKTGPVAGHATRPAVRTAAALPKVGVAACCALFAAAVPVLPGGRGPEKATAQRVAAEAASADYRFGFVSAALTACPLQPGATWQTAGDLVSRSGMGEVPPELARGFAAFATLSDQTGAVAACEQALSLFGPGGSVRRGLVEVATGIR